MKYFFSILVLTAIGIGSVTIYQVQTGGKRPVVDTTKTVEKSMLAHTDIWPSAEALQVVSAEGSWRTLGSLADVIYTADVIILGHATSQRAGRLVKDSAGITSLPFMNTEITVDDVIKGNLKKGEKIIVEQTGGRYPANKLEKLNLPPASLPPEAGNNVVSDKTVRSQTNDVWLQLVEDPLFIASESSVLFLRWEPKIALYQIVSPQGRFRIGTDQKISTFLQDDVVSKEFSGQSVSTLVVKVKATKQ